MAPNKDLDARTEVVTLAPTFSTATNISDLARAVPSIPSITKARIPNRLKRVTSKLAEAKTQRHAVITIVLTKSPEIGLEFLRPFRMEIVFIAVNAADKIASISAIIINALIS
jgi:hypothetical protein